MEGGGEADAVVLAEPGQGDEAPRGKKRGAPMSREESIAKIRRTIGWYNHNGGLASSIHYKSVRESLEAINPREALKILNELEEKSSQIRDPTAWVKRAAENISPELDIKVRKTIAWYNKHGNLQEQIKYDEVREALGWLMPADACRILKGLDGKEAQIQKPTAWICRAAWNQLERDGGAWPQQPQQPQQPQAWASKSWTPSRSGPKGGNQSGGGADAGGLDPKVKKTIGWYNKQGCLQAEIRFDEVAPLLAQVGTKEALNILQGLDPEKGGNAQIKNPTAWIKKAAQNLLV